MSCYFWLNNKKIVEDIWNDGFDVVCRNQITLPVQYWENCLRIPSYLALSNCAASTTTCQELDAKMLSITKKILSFLTVNVIEHPRSFFDLPNTKKEWTWNDDNYMAEMDTLRHKTIQHRPPCLIVTTSHYSDVWLVHHPCQLAQFWIISHSD